MAGTPDSVCIGFFLEQRLKPPTFLNASVTSNSVWFRIVFKISSHNYLIRRFKNVPKTEIISI